MGSRFDIVSTLGAGGQGCVYLARDAQREELVAIKRVRDATGASLLRLKAEFRGVAELRHPRLVRLFELGQDDDGLYFTMEAIDGVHLDDHLRVGQPIAAAATIDTHTGSDETCDTAITGDEITWCASGRPDVPALLDRLAPVLPAILEGLAALHGHGLVHRDLKPSNVMVARDGAVKLLDFGILAELGVRGELIGTPPYMAPEQISGGVLGAATDLYALGVLLYRAFAGQPPFVGSRYEVLRAHLEATPAPLDQLAPDVPAPIALACARLLDKRPERRPGLAWIDQHVLAPMGWPRLGRVALAVGDHDDAQLVGRAELQVRLAAAVARATQGGFATLLLAGPSGIGKTRLLEWLIGEARARGAVVLRGRARAHERVPYNALDGAIDGLARLCLDAQPDATDDRMAALQRTAASAFPVFWQRGADRPRREARHDAFAALAGLLRDLAAGGVLIALDDLQWADDDSLALLDHLVAEAPPGVLIVGTVNDSGGPAAVTGRLVGRPGVEAIAVAPLPAEALARVIARAARRRGVSVDTADMTPLIAQCDGRAMIAEVIGRGLAARADPERGALDALLDALPPPAQVILAALEIADHTVPLDLLARVVGEPPGAVEDLLVQLAADGLVHREPRDGGIRVDLYHEIVRVRVRARQSEPARRRGHDAFVAQLLADDRIAPERIVRHLVGAGRLAEAGERALAAAERARARFARGLAIEMYEVALAAAAPEARAEVLRSLGSCLDEAARYREAAARWRELAARVPTEERAEAAVHEAASLLSAADVVAGYARLDEATRQLGAAPLRGRGLGALFDGLRFVRGPGRARRRPIDRAIDASTRRRLDRDLHLAMLASYFDPLTGVRLLLRARDACIATGAPEDIAAVESMLAFMAFFSSDRRGPVRASDRWRAASEARVAHLAQPGAATRAAPHTLDAVVHLRAGDFAAAARGFDDALAILEAGGIHGGLEHLYLLVLRGATELSRQRVTAFSEQRRRLNVAYSEGGGSTVRAQVVLFGAAEAFLRGDLAEVRAEVRAFGEGWPAEPPTAQRSLFRLMDTFAGIGEVEPAALRRRGLDALAGDRSFRLMRSMDCATYWSTFALVEARAVLAGDPAASRRAVDRYAARALAAPPLGSGRALRARAYVATDRERAIDLLAAAEAEAARWDQVIDVAVARHMRGKRLGGDEGASLIASARDALAAAGAPGHWLGEDEV